MRVTAKLWVRDENFVDFETFEAAAFVILAKHGGKVLSVRKTHDASGDQPHEVHVLEFPDAAAFEAYKTDPALQNMAKLRDASIAKTEVTIDDA